LPGAWAHGSVAADVHEEVTIPELTEVVARVAALLGPREGAVAELGGGIANRNFRVRFGGTDYVLGLAGEENPAYRIDREAECAANKRAGELGLAPPVAAFIEDPFCLVTLFVDGRHLGPEELREPGATAAVARVLRDFHDSGLELNAVFDPYELTGIEAPGVDGHPEHAPVPCHNHLLGGNFLHDGQGVRIVDWELAAMGSRYFDIACVAAGGRFEEEHGELLLSEYFGEPPTDRRRAELGRHRELAGECEAVWAAA
jgi:hypothetical protein